MFFDKKLFGWVCVSWLLFNGGPGYPAEVPELGHAAEARDVVGGEGVMPTYWMNRSRRMDQVLLTSQQVRQVNQEILRKGNAMAFLAGYPEIVPAEDIRSKMLAAMKAYSGWELPRLFKNGKQLSWEDWQAVKKNCGFEIPKKEQTVRYGVTVKRTNIRLLPVVEGWYDSPRVSGIDKMQGGVLDPAEPVAVLDTSVDGKFFFVQSRNCTGWVDAAGIGTASREMWMNYVAPADYLVVTAIHRNVTLNNVLMDFQMGAHIPVTARGDGFVMVRLPLAENGALSEQEMRMSLDSTVNLGPLPYSRTNIIRQAFRYLGEPYARDGSAEGVTSASFVANVYRTVGIELPQGAAEQEVSMPETVSMLGKSEGERYALFFDAQAGTLLFQPGHVMLYLGRDGEGEPMVIHAHETGVTVSDLYDETEEANRIDLLTGMGIVR